MTPTKDTRSLYEQRIQDRSALRFVVGYCVRWRKNLKYAWARFVARLNGAQVGDAVVMPLSLAKKMNSNCVIGNHVTIETDKIDTRCPLTIGSNVIISGEDTRIITASHDVDSPDWNYKEYGLKIEDYVWIATNALILPSCRAVGYGSVVGAGSVVVKNVAPMSIISGNPAVLIRMRKSVHSSLVVESLMGGDFHQYCAVRKQ